ncbi:MAG: hypothetical protein KBT34_08530 [Prevotella sp.]|nr:hypothetical protein [Candidatus Prevotella equi]
MKTNKLWGILMMLVLVLGVTFSFSSCGGDDSDGSDTNTNVEWYANQNDISQISVSKYNFQNIENAIDNEELLGKTYVSNGRYIYYYAQRSMFVFGDGSFGTTGTTPGQKLGRLENTVNGHLYAIRIENSNTLAVCQFSLFVDEDMSSSSNRKKIATVFNGHIFKSVSVYLSENYYTYIKSDNKIIVSNGDIYTVTSSGLIKDGSSSIMKRFDPYALYNNKN